MLRKIFSGMILTLLLLAVFSTAISAQVSDVCPMAIYEGQAIQLQPEAFDPDPEIGPAGDLLWSFSEPFSQQGHWQTEKGQRGIYNFWVTVSDGELSDVKYSCVEVLPNNNAPVLEPVPEFYIKAGEETALQAECWDPDGDVVDIEYEFRGHPIAYVYYEKPGDYPLRVTCSDGYGGVDTQLTTLHITEQEQPDTTPVLPQPVQTIQPGQGEPETVVTEPAKPEEIVTQPEQVTQPQPQPIQHIEIVHQAEDSQAQQVQQPTEVTYEQYVEPQEGVCPPGYAHEVIIKRKVVETEKEPEMIECPPQKRVIEYVEITETGKEVKSGEKVIEIIEEPTMPVGKKNADTGTDSGNAQYEIVEQVSETGTAEICEPVSKVTETVIEKKIVEVPESVCKRVETTSVETGVQKDIPDVKTYVIQYEAPKEVSTPEKIVRKILRRPIDRKLEISGFLYSQYDCKCDHPSVEYYQELQMQEAMHESLDVGDKGAAVYTI